MTAGSTGAFVLRLMLVWYLAALVGAGVGALGLRLSQRLGARQGTTAVEHYRAR